jgi:phage shock protein A
MFDDWKQWKRWWNRAEDVKISSFSAEDPELLLAEAERQMREVHARNRERAIQALTLKNQFDIMASDLRKKIESLYTEASTAEERGDIALLHELRAEAEGFEQTLQMVEEQLGEAIETAEMTKALLKAEEEQVRRKTAEAMALRAQWRLVQVERSLSELYAKAVWDTEQIRSHLVEAVIARDELRRMVEETTRQIAELQVKADFAHQKGNDILERQLLREIEQSEASLEGTHAALTRAEWMVQRIDNLLKGQPWETEPDFGYPESEFDFDTGDWQLLENLPAEMEFVLLSDSTKPPPPTPQKMWGDFLKAWGIAAAILIVVLLLLLLAVR